MTPLTEARLAEIRADVEAFDRAERSALHIAGYVPELLAAVDGDAAAARAMTYAKELDAATAEVARLQAALRQAEGERLELAWFGLLPDELPDDVDWRRAHEVAELAKRIVDGVAAANGGRDGG